MKRQNAGTRSSELRERAEESLRKRIAEVEGISPAVLTDVQRLVHELEVHQIELEMQNDDMRKSQELLSKARDQYSRLYNYAPVGYFTLDKLGLILEMNLTGAQLLGYEKHFLLGKLFQAMVAEEYVDLFHLHKEEVFREPGGQKLEVKLRKSDETLFDAQLESHATQDEDGSSRCLTIVSDISDRKRAEERLRESEERYRQMFEKNRAVKLLIDPESSEIVDANQAAAEFYGYELERLKQLKISDINDLPPEDIFRHMAEAYSEEKDHFLFRHRLASGEVRYVEVYSSPLFLNGKMLLYSIIHDITDRHKAQEDLIRSNRDLEHFAYVASHDLQEPLRNVTSCLRLLEKAQRDKLDSDAHQLIEYAVDSADRMKNLVLDLLKYSRVATSAEMFHEVDSEEVLTDALLNLDSAVKRSGAVVTHDKLPAIEADRTQLLQVFQNLIGNAMKFRANESPRIHVSASRDNNEWVFSVRDNAVGIDSDYFDKIFVVFQQLDNRDKNEGTGIGLSIVKRIVERHGGRVWVESEAGVGSTFYFSIPVRKAMKP